MSRKNTLDQYYTNTNVADALSSQIKEMFPSAMFVEPAAGTGAFSNNFRDCLCFDIDPKVDGCTKQDFLTLDSLPRGYVVIGNPPFGKNGSLALRFINKSAELGCEAVCFVLPKTFKKVFFQNKIDRHLHLEHSVDLDDNSFILDDQPYKVPCVFQVWVRSDKERVTVEPGDNIWFDVVDKDSADFCVRRVGGKSGRILDGFDHSESTTYFLKSKRLDTKDKIDKLYPVFKEISSWTAGVRSLSIKEIIYELNKGEDWK